MNIWKNLFGRSPKSSGGSSPVVDATMLRLLDRLNKLVPTVRGSDWATPSTFLRDSILGKGTFPWNLDLEFVERVEDGTLTTTVSVSLESNSAFIKVALVRDAGSGVRDLHRYEYSGYQQQQRDTFDYLRDWVRARVAPLLEARCGNASELDVLRKKYLP